MSTPTTKQASTRRFYLFLPALVLPFITIGFWLMGGGSVQAETAAKTSGLNFHLPDAKVTKDSAKDKLAFYEQAASDSAKRAEQLRNDPYTPVQQSSVQPAVSNEPAVTARIKSIRERIRIPETESDPGISYHTERLNVADKTPVTKPTEDPEMIAINQTLDKLMELQRPSKAVETKTKIPDNAILVQAGATSDDSYFGRSDSLVMRRKFFDGEGRSNTSENVFSAMIPTTQILQAGSVAKLQLSQPITVSGHQLAAGHFVYGSVSFENDRMFILILSVRAGSDILPVALSVFDIDGMEGISIPGSITRDVIKSGVEQNLQSVNILSLDPSFKTQAAIAGIGAAKNLLGKKVRVVRATISAGYRVFLKNNKQ